MSLRIGIWTQTFPLASETFIVTKALGLHRHGLDVKVFSVNTGKDGSDYKILKQFPDFKQNHIVSPYQHFPNWLRFIPAALLLMVSKLISHPAAFFRLWRSNKQLCKELGLNHWQKFIVKLPFLGHQLDILHLEYDFQSYGMQDLPEILGCKMVISCRAEVSRMNVYRRFPRFYPAIFKNLSAYHFIATHLREEAVQRGLPSSVKTTIIHPAIDLKLFYPAEKSTNKPLNIISVGQLWWHKGYEFALEAFALLKAQYPEAQYHIIGHGDQMPALGFALRQLGLKEGKDVIFMGLQPREKIASLLREADIFLHAALQEGFCNAVIEAQASGLPVVTSDAGGLPENVADGISGFVVQRRNSKALAQKLFELAASPALRQQMGEAGRERVISNFGLEQQIGAFQEFYKSL